MSESLSVHLSRIAKAAPEINKLADQASEQIRALELHLNGMNLGVSFTLDRVLFCGREENRAGYKMPASYYLGYGRDDDGKFGLIVEAITEVTDKDGDPVLEADNYGNLEPKVETGWTTRLDRLGREFRIAAISQLPELIEAVSKKAESMIETLRGGVEKTQSVVDDLKAALSPVMESVPPVLTHHLNRDEQQAMKEMIKLGKNRSSR